MQQCLVQGINEDLEARYKRARYKDLDWKAQIERTAKRILENRARYEKVESETGVPWWVVGALHMRESSLSFSRWLANGDPLSGPTVLVPRGLRCPGNPPWEWHAGAIVSLNHQNNNRRVTLTGIGQVLDYCEHYNGLGYRQGAGRSTVPPSTSPYLWSGTTEYERGKYVADGKFDANAVDAQIGVAAIFMTLEEMQIKLFENTVPDEPPLPVSWFKIFRGEGTNVIVGYAGAVPVTKIETKLIDELITFRRRHMGANSFTLADPGEKIPDTNPQPAPIPKPVPEKKEPYIRIRRDQIPVESRGLVPLVAEFFGPTGERYGAVECISGLPGAQSFRKGPDSRAGSGEPLPQGEWAVGSIEWAAGTDNYSGSWGSGLGPVWVPVTPQFSTQRASIGFHRDDGVVGTLGCIGIPDSATLKELVRLLRLHDPRKLIVEWGL